MKLFPLCESHTHKLAFEKMCMRKSSVASEMSVGEASRRRILVPHWELRHSPLRLVGHRHLAIQLLTECLKKDRPDITVMVDWVLKINYLSSKRISP